MAPWFMDLELQSQDSSSNHWEYSHWAALLCLGMWVSGFLSSPLSKPQEHTGRERQGMEDWLLRVYGGRGKAWASPGCPAPGWRRTAASRSGSGREKRGQARRFASCPPFLLPPLVPHSWAAHLLSKGSNVLIEGIGGADVATWG